MATIGIALLGCGRIGFDLGLGSDAIHDGVPIDDMSPAIDVAPAGCLGGSTPYDFPTGPACAGWGTVQMQNNGSLTQTGSELRTQAAPSTASSTAKCMAMAVPITPNGVMVEVLQVANRNTGFEIGTFAITVDQGFLVATSPSMPIVAMRAYNSTQDRFWRIRPETTTTVFETAPAAGTPWAVLGSASATMPSTSSVTIGSYTNLSDANPGIAIFGSVDRCP